MNTVLVIAAHPDDEVLGVGGTIAKHVKKGDQVHILIVTDGSSSQYKNGNIAEIMEKKKLETLQAANILGVTSVVYGGLPDMQLDNTPHIEVNAVIENTIKALRPKIVYTHFWGDVNLDHKSVYQSTLVATRPMPGQCVKELYCYYVPSATNWTANVEPTAFLPNVYVDITEFKDIKLQAISCYKTEMRDFPHPRSLKYIQKHDEMSGLKVGILCAESFVQLRVIR